MNKHTVFVAGKRFVLLSDDKQKYVQKLATEVGDAIAKISEQNPTLDRRSAAILCALDYADDKYKAMGKSKSISDKAQPLIAQADKQSKQLRELKDQIAQRDKMIEDNKTELDSLRKSDKEQKEKLRKLYDVLDIREQELKKVRAELAEAQKALDEITAPDTVVHIPSPKKYEKAEKKQNKVDVTDDDSEEAQLFSLFD